MPLAIGTTPAQSHTPPASSDTANLPAAAGDAWLHAWTDGEWNNQGEDVVGDATHGNAHGHCIGVGHHHHGRGHGFGHDHGRGHGHDCAGPPPPSPKPVPTAEFTFAPAVPVATRSVQFDASSSTGGVDGNVTGTIVSYAWDFGDQTVGESVNPAHTFTTGGDISVSLTVTNDYGQSGTVTHGVHVVAPPVPVADFTVAPGAPVAGTAVQFDAATSTGGVTSDPSGDVTGTIVSYAWDFGDQSTAEGVSQAHAFAVAGDFTVGLTVTNDYGQSDTVAHGVHVVPPPVPVAAFTYTPGAPVAGTAVQFDAATSTGGVTSDPSGDVTGTIVSYAWDFGDQSNAEGVSPAHAFAAAGDFTVGLTVTNDYGQSDSATQTIHVVPPPPPYPGGETPPIVAAASTAFSRASSKSVTTTVRGGRRLSVGVTVGFALPARAGANVACAGGVTVKSSLRGAGRIAATVALHAEGGRCAARFKLLLPKGLAGKKIKLTFSFAGNDAVASWRLTKTVSVKPRS